MQRNQIFVLSLQKFVGSHETGGPGAKLGGGFVPPWPGPKTATGVYVKELVCWQNSLGKV